MKSVTYVTLVSNSGYLRGTRQPDTALFLLLRARHFQTNAGGNGAGGQGRWVTGAVK